jgi:hypothetical protein
MLIFSDREESVGALEIALSAPLMHDVVEDTSINGHLLTTEKRRASSTALNASQSLQGGTQYLKPD